MSGSFARRSLICLSLVAAFSATPAAALPWDIDMYRQQSFQANEMARAPAKGTVPAGSTPWTMTTEQAQETLQNPVPFSAASVVRGQRTWAINCRTCHGLTGVGNGPVGPLMAVPNILTDAYQQSTDGRVYGILMNGGSNMPRYGFKLSEHERWDVINYVRFLQGRDADGVERPK
ncbi:MAG: cytochrome c [Deltaproteobacteria bacterium]|nr:cytochrome c [Deltaproteobacteria bacterium]